MTMDFEGIAVIGAAVKLTNTAKVVTEALGGVVSDLSIGDRVCVVIEGVVTDVAFPAAVRGDLLGPRIRAHSVRAEAAAFVDDEMVDDLLAEAKERALAAREAAAGIVRLPLDDDESGDNNYDYDMGVSDGS